MSSKPILLALVVMSGSTSRAQAGDPDREYSAVLSVETFCPLAGAYCGQGNIRLMKRLSLIMNASHFTLESGAWSSSAYSLGTGLRYYWRETALRGWYAGPIAEVVFSTSEYESPSTGSKATSDVTGACFSALVGYQFIWNNGFSLDLATGATTVLIPEATVQVDGTTVSGSFARLYPVASLQIGYAF